MYRLAGYIADCSSLALAHGGARFDASFRTSIVDVGRDEPSHGDGRGEDDEAASTACAA